MRPTQAAGLSARDLYRQTRRAALVGLIVTLILAAAKFVGGLCGHSLALLADSVHSLGDAVSSVSVLGALWWAEQPTDTDHPYGHTRIESIAASYVAMLLIASGIWVGYEAVHTWNDVTPVRRGVHADHRTGQRRVERVALPLHDPRGSIYRLQGC